MKYTNLSKNKFFHWACFRYVNFSFQGVELDRAGNVVVDEFQNTSVPGVYSVGDVQGKFLLTPGNLTLSNGF